MSAVQSPAYAEDAVLGAILVRNENFHDAARQLTEDHFTSSFRRRLWSVMRDLVLAGELADVVSVSEAMPQHASEVLDICNTCFTANTAGTYIAIVSENWRKRQATSIAQRLLAELRESDTGAVDRAVGALLNLNAAQTECEFTGKQAMLEAWKQAEAAHANGGLLPGITTGLKALDEILGGWHDADLTLIGARPAMGKTALLVNLAEAASGAGYVSGLVSAEQPAIQIGLRRLALATGVGASSIRAGRIGEDDWAGMYAGLKRTHDRPLRIYDRSAITLDELVSVARKWKHAHDLKVLFIDYAQRITVPGADRVTEVSQVARGLKNLARDLKIPVIALAQVVKGVDSRPDKRPNAGDLANSDELTREADQVLMLYRDEIYNRESKDAGTAEILIEKNRHGPTGFKRLAFVAETMRFADLSGGEP